MNGRDPRQAPLQLPHHALSRVHLDIYHASPPKTTFPNHLLSKDQTLSSLSNNVGRYSTSKGHLLRRYVLHPTRSYFMAC
jgi:hypothetical protein